jgi:hypothetical protein
LYQRNKFIQLSLTIPKINCFYGTTVFISTHWFYLLPEECPPEECPPDECPPDECPPDECPADECPPDEPDPKPDDLDELCDDPCEEMLLEPDPELNDLEDDECD